MADKLEEVSALYWLVNNGAINENQKKLEFHDHKFMIDIYEDDHPDIVCMKSAQVGYSVLAILKSLWIVKNKHLNVIYVLPTQNLMKDFVVPKVNPLIYSNKFISASLESDRENLKSINKRFLYFKGAASEREAISITGDVLVLDEYDRMPDYKIVNTYDSRLQASTNPMRWRFSNPSRENFGVHALYINSDQMHWNVECHSCGHESFMDFERTVDEIDADGVEYFSHYVDEKRKIYACGSCDEEISNDDRRNGRWIPKYPERKRRGYWISQMMAPWVTAERILEQLEDSTSMDFFYNFVLGKAYTPSDIKVDRGVILKATAPSTIQHTGVAMGIDQDAGGVYYVLMTHNGIFQHGYIKSWEEAEHIKLMYKATVVCDPNPYQTMPKIMSQKHNDWYMCYFKDAKGVDMIEWKYDKQVVYADRTRIIDFVASEIINQKMLFRERPHQLEDVIAHWENLYRTTEEKEDGRVKSTWIKKEGRQSDYPFAMVYARIALARLAGGGSHFIEPTYDTETPITNLSSNGDTVSVDFGDIIKNTYEAMDEDSVSY